MDGSAAVDPLASELDKVAATRVAVSARGVESGVNLLLAGSLENVAEVSNPTQSISLSSSAGEAPGKATRNMVLSEIALVS